MRIIDGLVDGDLSLKDAARIDGMVAGTLTCAPGARVILCGQVAGDAVVDEGASLRVHGMVAGAVRSEGGRAVIAGMAGEADPADPNIVLDGALVARRKASRG